MFNGVGGEWAATIARLDKRGGELSLTEPRRDDPPNQPRLTLNLALLKGPAMDNALQKATELGVDAIALVQASRCNVAPKGDRLARRMSHWRGVLASACEQSGRTWLPTLAEPRPLAELLKDSASQQRLLLDIEAPTLASLALDNTVISIGPEGGWTEQEVALAAQSGATRCALASTTLRADTAAAAALVAVQQLWGWPNRA